MGGLTLIAAPTAPIKETLLVLDQSQGRDMSVGMFAFAAASSSSFSFSWKNVFNEPTRPKYYRNPLELWKSRIARLSKSLEAPKANESTCQVAAVLSLLRQMLLLRLLPIKPSSQPETARKEPTYA
jgi:hypothetical protein